MIETKPDPVALIKAVAASKAPRLSEQISQLIQAMGEHRVRLRDLLEVLHGRTYTLLLMLLALPFCLPIPLVGMSTPFGIIIALIGARLSLRLEPWLPQRLLNHEFSSKGMLHVLNGSRRLMRGLEYFLRPRLSLLLDFGPLHHVYGAIILICGLLLMLPVPVPFSNMMPAFTVVLIAAAMLEKDGFFVIAGLLMFLATLVLFAIIALGGAAGALWLRQWFGEVFPGDQGA